MPTLKEKHFKQLENSIDLSKVIDSQLDFK